MRLCYLRLVNAAKAAAVRLGSGCKTGFGGPKDLGRNTALRRVFQVVYYGLVPNDIDAVNEKCAIRNVS